MHARQTIRNAIVAALTGATIAGSNVFAQRTYAVSASNVPAIIVYTVDEVGEHSTIGIPGSSQREATLSIECYVKTQSNPDAEIDTLAEQIESILGANQDLGGAKLIEYKGININFNGDGDNIYIVAALEFTILYFVDNDDASIAV